MRKPCTEGNYNFYLWRVLSPVSNNCIKMDKKEAVKIDSLFHYQININYNTVNLNRLVPSLVFISRK